MIYFRLRDIYYAICKPTVKTIHNNNGLEVEINLNGTSGNDFVERPLKKVNLNINMITDCSSLYDLEGKQFKFTENAGSFTADKKYDIEMSKIHIQNIETGIMTIHWTGEISLPYSKKYGKHIPFDIEFKAMILE